jgi:hypothetical protein
MAASKRLLDGWREGMRNLLYVFSAMLLLGRLEVAIACSMAKPPSTAELFSEASTVFVGHIVRAEEIQVQFAAPDGDSAREVPAVEGTFRLVEVFKGEPPADRKIVSGIHAMCVQTLMVGLDYLVYLNPGSNVIVWVPGPDQGTLPLFDDTRASILEKLRNLSKKVP